MEVGLVVVFWLNGSLMGSEWVLMVVKNEENGGFLEVKDEFFGENGGLFRFCPR